MPIWFQVSVESCKWFTKEDGKIVWRGLDEDGKTVNEITPHKWSKFLSDLSFSSASSQANRIANELESKDYNPNTARALASLANDCAELHGRRLWFRKRWKLHNAKAQDAKIDFNLLLHTEKLAEGHKFGTKSF